MAEDKRKRRIAGISASHWAYGIAAIGLMSGLGACSEEKAVPPHPPRPIAWMRLEAADLSQIRSISGTLQAVESTTLSFEVAGKVQTVDASLGDEVTAGGLLARLDNSSYRLDTRAAEGQLREARAALAEARNEYNRQATLFEKGWVSKAGFDNAKAALDSAESAVAVAKAQRDLTHKALRDTDLRAPYDGVITARLIEPSQQVAAGQACFRIEGKQGLEIAVKMPETLVGKLSRDKTYHATFPAVSELVLDARVIEIGSQAEAGNTFPVTLLLKEQHAALRAGMTAELHVTYRGEGRDGHVPGVTVRVPPSALLSGEGQRVHAFVYDEAQGVVHRRVVWPESVIGNTILVTEGLKPGEIVATAGVAFLHDKQKVSLLNVGVERFN